MLLKGWNIMRIRGTPEQQGFPRSKALQLASAVTMSESVIFRACMRPVAYK
jgi:hypothetical protein